MLCYPLMDTSNLCCGNPLDVDGAPFVEDEHDGFEALAVGGQSMLGEAALGGRLRVRLKKLSRDIVSACANFHVLIGSAK